MGTRTYVWASPGLLLSIIMLNPAAAGAQAGKTAAMTGTLSNPRDMRVTGVHLSKRVVRPGETVYVSMSLRNQGPSPARSQLPAPSTVYSRGETFMGKGYAAQEGRYSIVMTVSGPKTGGEWPFRWGIGGDLPFNGTRRVTYPVQFTEPGIHRLYIGVAVDKEIFPVGDSYYRTVEVVPYGRKARSGPNYIPSIQPVNMTVNDKPVMFDQQPFFFESPITVSNVQMMVPIRFVVEAMGAKVQWHASSRTVDIERGENHLTLNAGSDRQTVNGNVIRTHVPILVVHGRTMVPIRFISQGLGGTVNWLPRFETVAIHLPKLAANTH